MPGWKYYLKKSERSVEKQQDIFEYNYLNASEERAYFVDEKINDAYVRITENPLLYPKSDRGTQYYQRGRKCVVEKHYFIIYEINDHEIKVLDIFDSRQDV